MPPTGYLNLVLHAHLPFVEADLSLMERVLENLIGNALQHTPAGGRVTVGVCGEGDQLRVQVADTGRGISVAELPFIFDRFYRGTDSRKRSAGAGRASRGDGRLAGP